MPPADCSLWILASEPDVSYVALTVSHLIRSCNFPFKERVLAVDTACLSGEYARRTILPGRQSLRDCCADLVARGVIDRVVDLDYSPDFHRQAYRKYFADYFPHTHGYRGYPVLGSLFCLEKSSSKYMLHFDCDMLLHQDASKSWIADGIELLQSCEDVVSVMPLPGPPAEDGELRQQVPYASDPRGFFSFKNFSSRCYLIDRLRFEKLLPLPIRALRSRKPLVNRLPDKIRLLAKHFVGKNVLHSFEYMVSSRLATSSLVRADLNSACAWTLHPVDHGEEFIEKLPGIIARVEAGTFPEAQSGHYDLKLELW